MANFEFLDTTFHIAEVVEKIKNKNGNKAPGNRPDFLDSKVIPALWEAGKQ